MQTQVLMINRESIALAARLLAQGQLVAFPTETVYGLGANALDVKAVARIFQAKGRPQDNPLIVHIGEVSQADAYCRWTRAAQALADAFWPGPLTMVLRKRDIIPALVSAGLATVGVRMPSHEGAGQLLRACGLPVAAPSANRSGRPSATNAAHVLDDLGGRIPLILDGGDSLVGLESTVLDMSREIPVVLRPGAVTPEQIAMVMGQCEVTDSLMRPLRSGEAAASPGMRHRHYAPAGKLTLVEGSPQNVAELMLAAQEKEPGVRLMAMSQNLHLYAGRPVIDMGANAPQAAHRLFYLLRSLDREGTQRIYCECLPRDGLGLAVMNRLARAAEFDIIQAG